MKLTLGAARICLFLFLWDLDSSTCDRDGETVVLMNTNITKLTSHAIHNAGYHLHLVKHISIIGALKLQHIAVEDLKKIPNLQSLSITQAPLLQRVAQLPPLPNLETFQIITSGLVEVPNLSHVYDSSDNMPILRAVDLQGNHIKRIPPHALRVRATLISLNDNLIEEVPAFAFKNAQIFKLSFRGNKMLKKLDENAFAGNLVLRQLDLSSTSITSLPTRGLQKLELLRIEKTPTLKYIPSIYEFQSLTKASLTHHFHCCAFAFPERHDPARHKLYQEQLAHMQQKCEETKARQKREARSLLKTNQLFSSSKGAWGSLPDTDAEFTSSESPEYSSQETEGAADSAADEDSDETDSMFYPITNDTKVGAVDAMCEKTNVNPRTVECSPQPNALNPCEDVMGWSWLRASVWFVVAAAVVGNLAVLVVLLANHHDMTVPRFLMCHLALADLCTGIYLFMVAVIDLRSYGEFFNYAYDWQYGVGCKIAGFLSVFSGQLSVFTLTIVTLERWFAITYAIYLERRISLASAAKIMVVGWLFCFVLAGLPLFGVSDYSSTSICLPVESNVIGEAIYQGSLFMTNAVAWVTIVVCYVQIYRSIGGGDSYGGRAAAAAAERRIANKMALLIGTDLLCWAPVAFFGITAIAGVPLVDVSHGKVLLVFFYPLNACANPFLYAILTKQYRRDFLTLLGRTGKCNWLVERYKLATTPPPTAHTHPSTHGNLLPMSENNLKEQPLLKKENGDVSSLV